MILKKESHRFYILTELLNNLYYYMKVYTVLILSAMDVAPLIITIIISLNSVASFVASLGYKLLTTRKFFYESARYEQPFRLVVQLGKIESLILILFFITCFSRSISLMIGCMISHSFISTVKSIEINNSFLKLANSVSNLERVFNHKQKVFEVGYSLGILFVGMFTARFDISFVIFIAFFLCTIHNVVLSILIKKFPIKQRTLELDQPLGYPLLRENVKSNHILMPILVIFLIETFLYGEDALSSFIYTIHTLNPEMVFGLQNGCMLVFSLIMLKIAEKHLNIETSILLGLSSALLSFIIITAFPINIYVLLFYNILTGNFSVAYANFGPYLRTRCKDESDESIASKMAFIESFSGCISPYILLGIYNVNRLFFYIWITLYYLTSVFLLIKEHSHTERKHQYEILRSKS